MRNQLQALGGWRESTRGECGCHPQTGIVPGFHCDDGSDWSGSQDWPQTKESRAMTQDSRRPRTTRSRLSFLRRLHAAGRSDVSRCAALLSHHGTCTTSGGEDHASRFASFASTQTRSASCDTGTLDSTGWLNSNPRSLRRQVRATTQQQSAPRSLSPAAHGTRRGNASDDDRNSRQTGDSSCSPSEEYADTTAARTQRPRMRFRPGGSTYPLPGSSGPGTE